MNAISMRQRGLFLFAMLALPATGSLAAQQQELPEPPAGEAGTTVYGSPPADLAGLTAGPVIEGFISARNPEKIQVTAADGTNTVVHISTATQIKSSGGFLGASRAGLGADQLLNGLPVKIRTVQWGAGLVASRIDLKKRDLQTATMIRTGTAQGFAEQTAATEALRGRVADIDQYNVKGATNVYFDVGKANLSAQAEADLCAAAAQANAMPNALVLVVGYTDSTGDYEYNQTLSERRASRVVNYLQQACGWKPYRMLTPTGMAEADPLASNDTVEGKAQNRRVAVNILVSKSVDGM